LLAGNDALAEKWYKIVEDEMDEYSKDSGMLAINQGALRRPSNISTGKL